MKPVVRQKSKAPNALNKICAHPVAVSWVLGACALNAAVFGSICHGVSLSAVVFDWQTILLLVWIFIPTTLLGYFLALFTCLPMLFMVICRRYNGAPFKAGDQVMILSGPQKGKIARVYEMTVGQAGQKLARVDLGQGYQNNFTDIFEEYALFKIKSDPSGEGNGSHPLVSATHLLPDPAGSQP